MRVRGHGDAERGSPRSARDQPTKAQMLSNDIHTTGYCDAKVANRDIRVWHFVTENGY
jgi:hypothetical protein